MKHMLVKSIPYCFLLIFALTACAQRQNAVSAELTTLHSGSLHVPSTPDAPMRIYVDAPDNGALAKQLDNELHGSRFQLVEAPSKAGYILHVKVLEQGQVSPEALKKAVDAGYGSSAKFHGQGSQAIMADALMVQRRVPEAKRPSRQKLKNISSRNALASAQMRMAVLTNSSSGNREEFGKAIAKELAERIRE